MILPPGVTGFDVPAEHSASDLRAFVGDCWQFAAPRKGCVETNDRATRDCANFFVVTVRLPDQTLTVLLNHVVPWVAFGKTLELSFPIITFDHDRPLAEHLEATGRYRVLTPAELDAEANLTELGPGERRQLDYWTRSYRLDLRVGDIVFNRMD